MSDSLKIWDTSQFNEFRFEHENQGAGAWVHFFTSERGSDREIVVPGRVTAEEAILLAFWHASRDLNSEKVNTGQVKRNDESGSDTDVVAAKVLRVAVAAALRGQELTVLSLVASARATPVTGKKVVEFLVKSDYLAPHEAATDGSLFWHQGVSLKGLWVHALNAADKVERLTRLLNPGL